MKRLLVTGSRDELTVYESTYVRVNLVDAIARLLLESDTDGERGVVVVHGHCPTGVDHLADLIAQECAESGRAVTIERHPASWLIHGRSAGPIRNAEMVALGADLCLSFPRPGSKGTWGCIREAANARIRTVIAPLPATEAAGATLVG